MSAISPVFVMTSPDRHRVRWFRHAVCLTAALLAVGCAAPLPAPGTSRDRVIEQRGRPTAAYDLPGGGQRLEYATGPQGRFTWMIDVDSSGRVTSSEQVLTEAQFLALQSTADLRSDDLLRRIGTPGQRRGGGLAGGEVWSWRYFNNDCLWFQASIADDRRVTGASYGNDPQCERGGARSGDAGH